MLRETKLQLRRTQLELDVRQATLEIVKKDPGADPELLTNAEKAAMVEALRPKYKLCEILPVVGMAKSSYECARSAQQLRHCMHLARTFAHDEIFSALRRELNWTCIKTIMYIDEPLKRNFYIEMCKMNNWDSRTLSGRIKSMLYERTAIVKKPDEVIANDLEQLREEGELSQDLVFRDPYLLDYLGLHGDYSEQDLESAIVAELQHFITELGNDFAFLDRQKRITIDGRDYYIDLLFFHRRLRRLVAIEHQQNADGGDKGPGNGNESIADIVMRADVDDLRAFIIEAARYDESLERELRATFGTADVKQAKRELQKATTTLMRRYEQGGFIDWREAMEFGHEYAIIVESIMRPFFSSKDAAALVDLAVPRLVQLQRICIDDSDGFFSDALDDVIGHLDRAFTFGDGGQRRRLLETLGSFAEDNPGKDRGDIYWFEQEAVEEFIADRFSQDAEFAPDIAKLANERLSTLPPVPESEYDRYRHERVQWASARLKAMATLGDAPDVLRDYAESSGLLGSADVVRLVTDAYAAAGSHHEAMALLRENLDAQEPFRSVGRGDRPPRIVDRLIEIANGVCTRVELAELYTALLLTEQNRSISSGDLTRWYDELHRLAGDAEWDGMREKLLAEAPDTTANTCLAHEGSLEELYDRIMANGGSDLMRFEKLLSDAHPEPYVERYIKDAMSHMEWANDRRAYRSVAADLAHAAGLPGGQEHAQEAASTLRAKYPRRRALLDELYSAGFIV